MCGRALLILLLFVGRLQAQTLPKLIPYYDGNSWGYADTSGKVVIARQWERVEFFANGKARVRYHKLQEQKATTVHCIIDTNGNYIIGPELNWSGEWRGWSGPLNAHYSAGTYGMIDTLGNIVIPLEYEATQPWQLAYRDSLRVLQKNGRQGVVDRQLRPVIQFKYAHLEFGDETAYAIPVVMVTDTFKGHGTTIWGLLSLDDSRLLPNRFTRFEYVLSASGKPVVRAQCPQSKSMHETRYEYYAYPSFKKIKKFRPDDLDAEIKRNLGLTLIRKEGHVFVGLRNKRGKVIVPCCGVASFSKDSIKIEHRVHSNDSLTITRIYLRMRDQKPYGDTQRILMHLDANRHGYLCGHSGSYMSRNPDPGLPHFVIEDIRTRSFFKDSFLYRIHESVTIRDSMYYVVSGELRNGNREFYVAIVDKQLNYVVPPVVRPYVDFKYDVKEQRFVAVWPPRFRDVIDSFSWKGMLYRVIGDVDRWGQTVPARLLDSAGSRVKLFRRYTMLSQSRDIPRWPEGVVKVRDSQYRVGFLYPDGSSAYPAFHFTFAEVTPLLHGWYLAHGNGTRRLVDSEGKDIIPGLTGISLLGETMFRPYFAYPDAQHPVDGLYMVRGYHQSTKKYWHFYIRPNGKIYSSYPVVR